MQFWPSRESPLSPVLPLVRALLFTDIRKEFNPQNSIAGDIGVSPAAASFLTGFSLTLDSTNTFSRSLQVVGKAFAANYAVPTPSQLTVAVLNMQTAFTDANGRVNPNSLNLGAGKLIIMISLS